MKWAFEYKSIGKDGHAIEQTLSRKQHNTPEEAGKAAGEWLAICAINDWPVEVRLVSRKDDE